MAAAVKQRGRKRGVDYWPEGGPNVRRAPELPDFTPRRALRAAGIRTAQSARRGTLDARHYARIPGRLAAAEPTGAGQLILYVFASILALAFLENVLGGRGPAGVSTVLNALGGGIRRLTDPKDPLIGVGPSSPASPPVAGQSSSSAPTVTAAGGKVQFTGASLAGVKPDLLARLRNAAAQAGATIVDVASGYRDPAHNAAVGGVPGSNHLTGSAIDGRAFLPGYGWVPLGDLPTLKANGIRSGNQPGFFNGKPDPNHVDLGA